MYCWLIIVIIKEFDNFKFSLKNKFTKYVDTIKNTKCTYNKYVFPKLEYLLTTN